MKFRELDARMRVFETAHDHSVLPGIYMVARLDGRGFTRLTKDVLEFDVPYDARFRDHMVATTEELMRCGLQALYGYTQSDEISVLFHRQETGFGRKLRKLNSVLAATASAAFSLRVGHLATFDCRISQLPTDDHVVDYFCWRAEDAQRNSLNAHCYWAMRRAGISAQQATRRLHGVSVSGKNQLLFHEHQINFNDLPNWHKRGVGLLWESYQKPLTDAETGETVMVTRKRIEIVHDLPIKDAYRELVRQILRSASQPAPARDDRSALVEDSNPAIQEDGPSEHPDDSAPASRANGVEPAPLVCPDRAATDPP